MNYYFVFGILSAALGMGSFLLIHLGAGSHPYLSWLVGWSLSAFVVYGIDKGLSKTQGPRAPELILNLLAAVGGFVGCWAGMFAFRHKSNRSKHPVIWLVLIASTIAHAALVYLWVFRG